MKWLICADATAIAGPYDHWIECEDTLENLFMKRYSTNENEEMARLNIDSLSIMTEEEFNSL